MSLIPDVNWLATVVGAIGFFALGALWYGPLFGKRWMAGMGLDPTTMSGAAAKNYAVTFAAALVLAIFVSSRAGIAGTVADAIGDTLGLWLGLVATTAAINAVWDARPWSVYAINVAYHLAGMLVVAIVAAAWPG